MSDIVDEFEELLHKAMKQQVPIQTQWVKIQNVRKEERLCDAKDIHSDLDFYDVWLGLGSDVKIPTKDTTALIGLIDNNPAKAFLITCEEYEQWIMNVDGSIFKMDKDGFLLKKENETLKALMADLITAIKAMKFTTNNGPTINLINKPQFTALEKRFNGFLKD